MGYTMHFKVDGGCRRNGYDDAIGAAAAVWVQRWGKQRYKTKQLSNYEHVPTSQRAEIEAIILALEWALEKYDELDTYPWFEVTIESDSKYAVNCMNEWIYKWHRNGWMNAARKRVKNSDLIQEASRLDDAVKELGNVTYVWIPRADNEYADELCNEELDEQEGW